VLRHFGVEEEYGAYVETRSDIPIARGLKSSSVAANAIALAVIAALGEEVDDVTVVNLGVDAAMEAGVTITGAFDDASASYFGGLVITDNRERKILKRIEVEEHHPVLVYVPPEKAYTVKSNVERMKLIANEVKALHKMAYSGDYWSAMTLNGIVYSAVLGYDAEVAIDALAAGALAAGLSGTGPAVAAVVPESKVEEVKKVWRKYGGAVIETRINLEKSHIIG